MEKGHNNPPAAIIELDDELAAFVVENCEVNVRQMMGAIQAVHDDKLDLKKESVEKLIDYIEKFRKLQKLIEAARAN